MVVRERREVGHVPRHRVHAQSRELPGFTRIGLPLIEMYRTNVLTPDAEIHHTEVYIPIAPTDP